MEKTPKKMTIQELQKYIISEAMKMLNAGEALEVEMNQNDKEVGSDGNPGTALVKSKEKGGFEKKSDAPAKAENIEATEEATEVKMNQNDKEGGSDEKIAAAVSVEATGSTKKGSSVEGMHNAKFDSKDKNPSVDASKPFEEKKEKVEMNAMDKEGDQKEGAKTFVAAGSEMSKGHSTGQAKANFSEEAKNEKEKAEAIAKAIQLPENFKNKKELLAFISESAKKVSATLLEMDNKQVTEEGLGDMFKKAANKVGQALGTKWDQATAEKEYNTRYARTAQQDAQKYGVDANTYKNAIVKFMMDHGGLITPKNSKWNAQTKQFDSVSTGGGAGSLTGSLGGAYEE
jgi:hypothetical protein